MITVNPALTAPSTPTVSATKLDANQPLNVSSIVPSTGTAPYSWQWLVGINSSPPTAANAIAVCPTSNNGIAELAPIATGQIQPYSIAASGSLIYWIDQGGEVIAYNSISGQSSITFWSTCRIFYCDSKFAGFRGSC